jgi:hypothetical protein
MYLPLLHRPTFQNASGLHRVYLSFGAVVLLVCALGAKYSDDLRVLLDGVDISLRWMEVVRPGTAHKEVVLSATDTLRSPVLFGKRSLTFMLEISDSIAISWRYNTCSGVQVHNSAGL